MRRALSAAALVTAVVVAAMCAGCTPSARRPAAVAASGADGLPHTAVDVSETDCGQAFTHARPGAQVFDVHNSGGEITDVYLIAARTGAVYAEAEGIGTGGTRSMRVTLGNGSYAFECLPEDLDVAKGPAVRVTGASAPGTPAILPADVHDLIPTTLTYQKWVQGRLDELATRTDSLRTAIDRGDSAGARAAWLSAHLLYEELSGAKLTFAEGTSSDAGDLDAAVNGTAFGLPGGVHDPDFTGFHRIEYGLWHGEPLGDLRRPTDQLLSVVTKLRDSWPRMEMDPLYMSQRAHEIMENSLQFQLTGQADYGSGSGLATMRANLTGTEELLDCLRPVLKRREPSLLPKVDTWMQRTRRELDGFDHRGTWTSESRLDRRQRETLSADAGELIEQLAPIAVILDVRRTQ